MHCEGQYVLLLMLLWSYDVLLSDVLENYFVTLSNYKLDDSPLKDIDMAENNWTIRKCVFMCNHLENCKTVTVKKDKTRCKLFSVSEFGIGSTPVKDNEWQALSISGKCCQSCSFLNNDVRLYRSIKLQWIQI